MPPTQILTLRAHRQRREKRIEVALALYGADPARSAIVAELREALATLGGERAAVLWVDEYGEGRVHTRAVLDLASKTPRRSFPLPALAAAWREGAPGLSHIVQGRAVGGTTPRSICSVALGSDGLRWWFFTVDGLPPVLSVAEVQRMHYLAGRVSSVVMHEDLEDGHAGTLLGPEGGKRFAAWPILKDLEGRDSDDDAQQRVTMRFMVARVIRQFVDDDLAPDRGAIEQQMALVRSELGDLGEAFAADPERPLWHAVLDAAGRDDFEALAWATVALARVDEELGHLASAREICRSAYQIAMIAGMPQPALEAARRFTGLCERLGHPAVAGRWAEVERGIAASLGDGEVESGGRERVARTVDPA